jgi:cbb3-type cytochrome oxidase subunit 3
MSSDLSAEITAIATAALAAFAIFTTVFAILAFRKQSKEVSDQAAMLKVQSDQLEEQRKVNAEQTRVLALQVKELGESLEERRREALERRSSQASQVFVREERYTYHAVGKPPEKDITVYVRNTSKPPCPHRPQVRGCARAARGRARTYEQARPRCARQTR